MIHNTDPLCGWCKQPASAPGLNDRGERCPCRCHPKEMECPASRRVDGPKHSWVFDGDDPYIVCAYCAERRDAVTGRIINHADRAPEERRRQAGVA